MFILPCFWIASRTKKTETITSLFDYYLNWNWTKFITLFVRLGIESRTKQTEDILFIWQNLLLYFIVFLNRKQDEKEALEKLKEVDINSDGQMSWPEYLKKVYGYTVDELNVFKKDLSPEMQSFLRVREYVSGHLSRAYSD